MVKRSTSKKESFTRFRPRKRVAIAKPNASTKAIIARNASTSPLLQLPFELRDKIWIHVLGQRLIHLEYNNAAGNPDALAALDQPPWQHIVCQRHCLEDEPDKRVVLDEEKEKDAIRPTRHDEGDLDDCDPYCLSVMRSKNLPAQVKTQLNVLRASRQMYAEANRILWTTNTFSFTYGSSFKEFIRTRNLHQKRLIRNLRLKMQWGYMGEWPWNRALNLALVKSCTGLRTLRLRITLDMKKELWDRFKDGFVQQTDYAAGLRRLSILPLTSAEVVVRTSPRRHNNLPLARWEKGLWLRSDMDQCADEIRRLLVDPTGAEVYAKHLKQKSMRNVKPRPRSRYSGQLRASTIGLSGPGVIH
ncbi:MAG: hypothetical protein Q9184_005072 [Pyrenodesmia sp. 2 TL-2023]